MQVDEIKTKHESLKEAIRQLITQYQEETGCQVSLVVHSVSKELTIDLTTVIE